MVIQQSMIKLQTQVYCLSHSSKDSNSLVGTVLKTTMGCLKSYMALCEPVSKLSGGAVPAGQFTPGRPLTACSQATPN